MIAQSGIKRRAMDVFIKIFASVSALLGIAALAWIIIVVLQKGSAAINWTFFTSPPAPPGMPGGGLSSAIAGTLLMTVLATLIGVPAGVFAGIYLSEFGQNTKLGSIVRFATNNLMGIPSIIVGLFIYTLLVVPFRNFSGYAGAVALSIIMMPVVARTTEDMLILVPQSLRESALALWAARWRVTMNIVFRAAKAGVLTGILLSIARVSGETAPLLFTALNSPYFPTSLREPTANLTVTIFNYAMSPYPDWQVTAWGASLLIMVSVLTLTIFARILLKEQKR